MASWRHALVSHREKEEEVKDDRGDRGIDVLMTKLSLQICGWSVEWWWVGFCQFVGGCLDLLGCLWV
nr:hypothetical protein CFP56_30572 [Quercus suber]